MLVWLGYDIQRKLATEGLCNPVVIYVIALGYDYL
jgi:hypothetical protein